MLGCVGVGALLAANFGPALRSRVPARGVYAISCLVTAVPTLVIALTHSVALVAVMLVAAGAAWITGLGLLSAAYQGELPAWAKARAFAYYLVAFQGAMGVGALVLGAVAQATSVTTALVVVAAGLAASLVLTWLLPMPEGAAAAGLEHAADPLPLPEELTEEFGVTGRRGPVTVTVAYALADGNADKFIEQAKQLRRMRRRTGAIHWHLHQDIDDPLLFSEMFVVASWEEHQHQHARTEHVDQQLLAALDALLRPGAERVARHAVSVKP